MTQTAEQHQSGFAHHTAGSGGCRLFLVAEQQQLRGWRGDHTSLILPVAAMLEGRPIQGLRLRGK